MTTSPVILPMSDDGIYTRMMDGAYYVARDDAVQIVVVGPMHFTPGDYIDAFNELIDSHYELTSNSFMDGRHVGDQEVLRHGFVSLIGIKRS